MMTSLPIMVLCILCFGTTSFVSGEDRKTLFDNHPHRNDDALLHISIPTVGAEIPGRNSAEARYNADKHGDADFLHTQDIQNDLGTSRPIAVSGREARGKTVISMASSDLYRNLEENALDFFHRDDGEKESINRRARHTQSHPASSRMTIDSSDAEAAENGPGNTDNHLADAGGANIKSEEEPSHDSSLSSSASASDLPLDIAASSTSHVQGSDQTDKKISSNHAPRSLSQEVGDAYFRLAGQAIEGTANDDSFGKSISMSEDGNVLAVSGNLVINTEESYMAYVQIYNFNASSNTWNQIGSDIIGATIGNQAFVEIFLSGNGNRLAFATVYRDDNGHSSGGVIVHENNNESWEVIGNTVMGGVSGDLPGLKVCMSFTGDRLVVGSRYYTDSSKDNKVNIGRTRIFQYESGDWAKVGEDLVGDSQYDYAGSSVAMTADGSTVAIGATGDDSIHENTGRVKVYRFNVDNRKWERRGNEIIGEDEDDESGFSVAIADSGTRVAIGAIYNDGDDGELRHSGHVRVYDFVADDESWQQIGSDIDGDHGFVVDFFSSRFHVGDALGFSISMSAVGDKLAIGAPFYSQNRNSGYYGGVTKLYELVSDQWTQIAYNLDDSDIDATSGYSVALSSNGRRFATGSPGPVTGVVRVYDQLEVSNFPSLIPSMTPSGMPSQSPSAQPSSTPSVFPSVVPTKLPSIAPSIHPSLIPSNMPSSSPSVQPSFGPTSDPSTQPSDRPSIRPSVELSSKPSDEPSSKPSSEPSSQPSDHPSQSPSSTPSSKPSDIPSDHPSYSPSSDPSSKPSDEPSSKPSSEPSSQPSDHPSQSPSSAPSSKPSDIPSDQPSYSPSSEPSSKPSDEPSSLPTKIPSTLPSFQPSSSPSIEPSSKPSVDPSSLPSKIPSAQPSLLPSNQPSNKPSTEPSSVPSGRPTKSPSLGPSLSPSSSPRQTPSSKPSFLPSFGPSLTPSKNPSKYPTSTPSILPSNMPSSMPTTVINVAFAITSSFPLFDRFSDDEISWCMQASGVGEGAVLFVRPCDSNIYQRWYLDSDGKLHLQNFTEFCVVYEGRMLGVRSCDDAKPITLDRKNHSISFKKRNKTFYICVDSFKAFSKLSLLKEGSENSSWNTWHWVFEESLAPSMIASDSPTTLSSAMPSRVTSMPSASPSGKDSEMPTISSSATPSFTPSSVTSVPSGIPTMKDSEMPTISSSATPSFTPSSVTSVPSGIPTVMDSQTPSIDFSTNPSFSATSLPSQSLSEIPSTKPSHKPSNIPSLHPSEEPSGGPTESPTEVPSRKPSQGPSAKPSFAPSVFPTQKPSGKPSGEPTFIPTQPPSGKPSGGPSTTPTAQLSLNPSLQPSEGPTSPPTQKPSRDPSATPSDQPSFSPSIQPSSGPTKIPSQGPSRQPSDRPTIIPTKAPSGKPSQNPSTSPSFLPSSTPTVEPSMGPSVAPTQRPSVQASNKPTFFPSAIPTDPAWRQMYNQVLIGEASGDYFGYRVAMSADGKRIAVGGWKNQANGINSGHVRVFEDDGTRWFQLGNDLDGWARDELFGFQVSLSNDGSILAVSAPQSKNDSNVRKGSVRVYQYNSDSWVLMYNQDIEGENNGDVSGHSISLSPNGSVMAIGAWGNDPNGLRDAGHVRTYRDNNQNWVQFHDDIDGEAVDDFFGGSVSLSFDGSRLAIGIAKSDNNGNTDAGRVRVYEDNGATWEHMYNQDLDGEGANDWFGWSVSLSSDGLRLAVGAVLNSGMGPNAGHVRIFRDTNSEWEHMYGQDLDADHSEDQFGGSVSMSADGMRVAIGAQLNDEAGFQAGKVTVYEDNGADAWVPLYRDILGTQDGDFFGGSVAMSADGNRLVVGAYRNTNDNGESGHVRIFQDPNSNE